MTNRVFGSTLIIAGTAVGAGMLAMPLTSAQMGFGMTFALLFFLWVLLTFTALLYAEVHQYSPYDYGIAGITEQYFGLTGKLIVNFILLFFMYAVLTAYITGSGDLLFSFIPNSFNLAPEKAQKIASLSFAILFGIIVTIGIALSDITNRLFFALKVISFIILLYLLFGKFSITNLQYKPTNNLLFFSALPIFFMTFGFHICTPTINEYLKGDNRKLRMACFFGSTGIFIIYIIWQMATHGVLKQSELIAILNETPNLNGLIQAFEVTTGSKTISEMVRIFSLFALTTSYIGVSLGLSNAVKDLLSHFNMSKNNTLVGAVTFIPPIIVGFTYPNIFLSAFSFAGVIFAFIGVILPVALVYKARKRNPQGRAVRGGNLSLLLALLCAGVIIVVGSFPELLKLPSVVG
ncbi:aromatic amino acid transport family protein [Ignatzschineria larvae DSM 13226]|uniref:Aromatic amino acid transport family protein n=1 Tax=Ignatzschineria larvae DSM 13226 TaxID=1111732 RepID=A0ABZ3BYM7_9GAMM|nr:aromatic amino acid transport family protein [Ignatzschineria larvae]